MKRLRVNGIGNPLTLCPLFVFLDRLAIADDVRAPAAHYLASGANK
jgi:hypothetical protein